MAGSSDRPLPWPTIGKLVAALLAAGVLVAGLLLPYVGGLGLVARHEANKFLNTTCNLTESAPPQKTELLASDGKTVIATLFKQDRVPVPLSSVPTYLQQALVATEDRRFYEHHGVDMRGLIRSAINTSNGDTQGGSTLTMQYVKQVRYFQASQISNLAKRHKAEVAAVAQNLQRKMEDAKCALAIEKRESKNQIMDNYLNIAFFGENAYGIQTAAETYFNKNVQDLTLPESAMLVGVLRAPTAFDPFVHPDAARTRRNEVLQNLVAVGDLSQAQAKKYQATPIQLGTDSPPPVKEGCTHANPKIKNVGFFCAYVKSWLENVQGLSDSQINTGGLRVVTTLDVHDQNTVQKNLSDTIPAKGRMTAIMPVVDPKTGDVLAMASSKRYGLPTSAKDRSHTVLPIFTSQTAFGASTYKLFPLLAALSTGVPSDWPLETVDPYRPTCTTPSKATNGDARETYDPNETLASATAKSSNTFFVGLADQLFGCDLKPIVHMAQKLGMKSLAQPSDIKHQTIAQTIVQQERAQQLVLGDISTSPLELAGAYAAVADDGKFNAPAPVLSITATVEDTDGNKTTQNLPVKRKPGVQVVNPQVARQAIDILTGDTTYPGTSAGPFESWYSQNPSVVAGKTGTAVAKDESKNSSIWFVGLTPDLVAATAIVDLDSPFAASRGLPGETSPGSEYGDYASGVWLDALEPLLVDQQWAWPSPEAVPGGTVPDVTGKSLSDAKSLLADAGYKMRVLGRSDSLLCASGEPYGTVGYFAPQIAPSGSTITVCQSRGTPQQIYTPPPPPPVQHPTDQGGDANGNGHGDGSGNGGGGSGSSGGSGGSGGGSGSGGSGGTSTPGPGNGHGAHHGPGGPGH